MKKHRHMEHASLRTNLCEMALEQFFREHPEPDAPTMELFLAEHDELKPELLDFCDRWLKIRRNLLLETVVLTGRELVRNDDSQAISQPMPDGTLADGRYRLVEPLGKGCYGTVWKAQDTLLGRAVAIKMIETGISTDEFRQSEKDLVAGRMRHDHIVRVFDVGRTGHFVYIVSELIEGENLRRRLKRSEGGLAPREACLIVRQIADALHEAHGQQVVHRDIKPENIMLQAGTNRPMLLDFGLALLADDFRQAESATHVGTIAYMAPEQARGESFTADARTDIYALGVVFYELLAGERPFRGRPDAILRQIRENDPPDPRRFQENIPDHLAQICMKCLEKRPEDRFQTAARMRDEISGFLLDQPPGTGICISRLERMHRWVRRNPVPTASLLSLATVLLLIIAIGIAGMYQALASVDDDLAAQALAINQAAARLAATQVGDALTRELQKIEALARSPSLIADFQAIHQDEPLRVILNRLSRIDAQSPPANERTRPDPQDLAGLVQAGPIQKLQNQVHRQYQNDIQENSFVFSWFALSADGVQMARAPLLDSIGQNYAWRSYFHGGPTDWPTTVAGGHVRPRMLEQSHISPVFISIYSRHPVIAISSPVKDPAGTPLGVIAKMLEFGKIIDLRLDHSSRIQFAILDMRQSTNGIVLQHPYYQKFFDQSGGSTAGNRLTTDFRVPLESIQNPNSDYHDPFAQVDPAYDGRWLASSFELDLGHKKSGIYLLAQVSHEAIIGRSMNRLSFSLLLLFMALVAISLAAIVPLWIWLFKQFTKSRF